MPAPDGLYPQDAGHVKEEGMKEASFVRTAAGVLTAIVALSALASCGASQATIGFSITDAPIDTSTVKEVNLTVSSIGVNENGAAIPAESSWIESAVDPPVTVNLLGLQNGFTAPLGDLVLRGGTQVNQIRLGIDSIAIVEVDDSVHEAILPSATGFKIVNAFQVPLTGEIGVSIDFDVRKSVFSAAGGYFVKPAMRAVVDGEAGRISGGVGSTGAVAVYAYADGTYADAEAVPAEDGTTFQGAYSATLVKDDGTYVLAFMEPGVYDLYAVDVPGVVVGALQDVAVVADRMTDNQDF